MHYINHPFIILIKSQTPSGIWYMCSGQRNEWMGFYVQQDGNKCHSHGQWWQWRDCWTVYSLRMHTNTYAKFTSRYLCLRAHAPRRHQNTHTHSAHKYYYRADGATHLSRWKSGAKTRRLPSWSMERKAQLSSNSSIQQHSIKCTWSLSERSV